MTEVFAPAPPVVLLHDLGDAEPAGALADELRRFGTAIDPLGLGPDRFLDAIEPEEGPVVVLFSKVGLGSEALTAGGGSHGVQ